MKFVATKTSEQLDLQALHRVRERLVSQRTFRLTWHRSSRSGNPKRNASLDGGRCQNGKRGDQSGNWPGPSNDSPERGRADEDGEKRNPCHRFVLCAGSSADACSITRHESDAALTNTT